MLKGIRIRRGSLLPNCCFRFAAMCVIAITAARAVSASDPQPPLAIFHVGNSLTDQAYGMHDTAKARGHETKFGRHMIPGAPLQWLWEHRDEGFRAPDAKKPADDILKDHKWDVLILQPFGRSPENSIEFGVKYAEAAYVGNPDCHVYVFANYPQIGNEQERKDEWEKRWLSETDTRGRATFEKSEISWMNGSTRDMTQTHLDDVVDTFLAIWNTQSLPPNCGIDVRAMSLDEAYAVQRRVVEKRVAHCEHLAGYKVGCTSTAIRRQFGLSEPIYGRLTAPHVHYGETPLNWNDYVQCAVEPEFVIRIGQDVDWSVTDERELTDAIEWVAPGIEVHNFKFWFGAPSSQELVASNGIHAGLVVGKQQVPPAEFDFDMEGVSIFRNDELMASGIGAEIMGGPLKSLRWLIGRLRQEGERLRAGQLVIPGSPVELVSVRPNDRITAAFTHLGSVSTRFST